MKLPHEATPVFTVVIPTRNRPHLVTRAVRSVLGQDLAQIEVIVVDDGPDRETQRTIEGLNDERIIYHPQEHAGVCAARNRGASLARAPWLTFLDSDDEALQGWLSAFAEKTSNPAVSVVCCGVRFRRGPRFGDMEPDTDAPGAAGIPALFLAGSFAVRRQTFTDIGGYWTDLTYAENTELGLRLIEHADRHGWHIATIPRPLVTYHQRPEPSVPTVEQLRARLASSRRLLDRHGASLRYRDPRLLAKFLDTAGVRAARLGNLEEAREFFRHSVRTHPSGWKHYARWATALWPPLATMVWGGVEREAR